MSEQNGDNAPWSTDGAVSVRFHGRDLFRVGAECYLPLSQRHAIAERIVACLNCCEGVDTSALTPGRLGAEIVANGKHLVIKEGTGL